MEDKAKCVFLVFGGGGVEQGGPSDGLKILPAANFCRKIISLTKNRVEDKARLDFVFFGAGEGVKQGGPRDSLRILPAKYFCRKIRNQTKTEWRTRRGLSSFSSVWETNQTRRARTTLKTTPVIQFSCNKNINQ